MKKILFIVIFFSLGCSIKAKLNTGCYIAKDEKLNIYYYVNLKENHSYSFEGGVDLAIANINGYWNVRGNSLILNSNIQPDTKGFSTEQTDSTIKDRIKILLFDINGNEIDKPEHVYINIDTTYFSPVFSDGNKCLIAKSQLSNPFSIGIGSEYKQTEVKIKNPKSNVILVYLVPNTEGFYQTNEKFKILDSSTFKVKNFYFSKVNCNN